MFLEDSEATIESKRGSEGDSSGSVVVIEGYPAEVLKRLLPEVPRHEYLFRDFDKAKQTVHTIAAPNKPLNKSAPSVLEHIEATA